MSLRFQNYLKARKKERLDLAEINSYSMDMRIKCERTTKMAQLNFRGTRLFLSNLENVDNNLMVANLI